MALFTPPEPQTVVDKYLRALRTPHKLLSLHPRGVGHPGNAAVLSPAIVLTSISAFEGFAEDFLAVTLAHQGAGFAEIAKAVGAWNNPALPEFAERMKAVVPSSAATIDSAASVTIPVFPTMNYRSPTMRSFDWTEAKKQSRAWMQVRHALTHGLTTGWRAEQWPPPLRQNDPHANTVLRPMRHGDHSLVIAGAISCARIYSFGAQKIANAVAGTNGWTLNWDATPDFD